MKSLWLMLKDSKIFWAFVVGLVLFCAGYVTGHGHKTPVQVIEHTVEDTVSKQKLEEAKKTIISLQEQLVATQKKFEEAASHVKTVVHIVKQKDGTIVVDKTTEVDSSHKSAEENTSTKTTNSNTVATDDKKEETKSKNHTDVSKTTTPVSKPWFIGPLVTFIPIAPVGQQFVGGLVFGRYLGTIPLLDVPVSAAISVGVPLDKPISLPSVGAAITVGF